MTLSTITNGTVSDAPSQYNPIVNLLNLMRGEQTVTEAVLVSGVDASVAENVYCTLTANRVVGAPLNPVTGQKLHFVFTQNGTGGWTITWNAAFSLTNWALNTAANAKTEVTFSYIGTSWVVAANPATFVLDSGGEVYNVKNPAYGAVGNGVAGDDTAATNAVITAAQLTKGGIVFYPSGSFAHSTTVTVPVMTGTSTQGLPLIFRGTGWMQDGFYNTNPFGTILIAKGLAGDMITTDTANAVQNHVALESMSIFGNIGGGSQSAGDLVHLWALALGWVRDVEINSAFRDGLRIEQITGIKNCDICSIDHVRVEKCLGGNGINMNGMIQGAVTSSHVESCAYGIVTGSASSQCALMGNSVGGGITNAGMQIGGSQNRVIGNFAELCGQQGIYVAGIRCVVEGNVAIGNGSSNPVYPGMHLQSATYCTMTANISSDQGLGRQSQGFLEDGASDFNVIANNDFRGNLVNAVSGFVGASTVFRDNLGYNSARNLAQTPAFNATPAPDPTLGEIYRPAAMTGAVAVANPVNSTKGAKLRMYWLQDGTGGRALTYPGSNWRATGLVAQVTTLNTLTIDEAECVDGTVWRVVRLVTGQTA